jgi:mono/diheme cytochrome c family protein
MAGLVPAISLRDALCSSDRDARHKAGHDGFNHVGRSLRMVRCASLAAALCVVAAPALSAQTAAPSYTAAQAERGKTSYQHSCQDCHGSELDNGDFGGPPLRGSAFRSHWGSGSAGALFAFLKATMPPDNPGGLTDTTYADILAFVLQGNGYPAGDAELPSDADALQRMMLGR